MQPVPPEWSPMLHEVSAVYNPSLSFEEQHQAADCARQLVTGLNPHIAEILRFYVTGLGACNFAKVLVTPEGTEQFVSAGADALVRTYDSSRPAADRNPARGMSMMHLFTSGLKESGLAVEKLEPRVRVLSNALMSLSVDRERLTYIKNEDVHNILGPSDLAVDRAVTISLDGALLTLRKILETLYTQKTGKHADVIGFTLIKHAADEETIANLKLHRAFMAVSRTRGERAFPVLDRLFKIEEDGTVNVVRGVLPALPPEKEPTPEGRAARLRCPARYIEDLIPLVARLMPEIINRAQATIMARGSAQ
jgi:hypothetical protein